MFGPVEPFYILICDYDSSDKCMFAVVKKGIFDVDGTKVEANFQILGRALEGGVSTAVSLKYLLSFKN